MIPSGRRGASNHSVCGAGRYFFVVATVMLVAQPALADPWYEHYSNAEIALKNENWTSAVQEINDALEKKGDSGARERTYGMKVTSYFPYFKLGVAYYHLGELNAALQAFETEQRLGAITQSDAATAEFAHYYDLTVAERDRRIRQIVEQSIRDARDLESRGQLAEAIATLDRALAVAPGNSDAQSAMDELRHRLAARERKLDRDRRASDLVEAGEAFLSAGQYGEASSRFRQAMLLESSAKIEQLLDEAQRNLRVELDSAPEAQDERAKAIALDQVRALESAGQLAAALDRLQSILALAPSDAEAKAIQNRLLKAQMDDAAESARQTAVAERLAQAESKLKAGSAEEALSAANQVLALDPGNHSALGYVAQAYGEISRRLLGRRAGGNIPPAVRFVDLRQKERDGVLVEEVVTPSFRLSGVIIDNSPVEVAFSGNEEQALDATLNGQPLGDYYLTEFTMESRLPPGLSTFRLMAKDSENLMSSSQYSVYYDRPFLRAPQFYALLLGSGLLAGGALVWQRARRREQLRTRRFNPYVAGAPVLEEDMFFGRRELVDRILQTIHNNNLLIYGERRIGKTSIQHQLKKRLSELCDPVYEFYPVYIDLQGTPEERFFQTIAEDIFQELGPMLDSLRPGYDKREDYSYRTFVRDVHAVLKILKKRSPKKIKLILLIDEVDVLNGYDPGINQKLRSLFMKSFAEDLGAVVSGVAINRQWEREGSPWYNFFEEIEVKPLTPEEARELIERPIHGVFKLDDAAADKIIALTGGKPYSIQKLCISLVTRLHEHDRRRITLADVEAVSQPSGA